MSVHPKSAAVSCKLFLAQKAFTLSTWKWFADAGVCRTRDEFEIMPRLLFELYLAHKAGKKLSKTEASRLMKVDRAVTGPHCPCR